MTKLKVRIRKSWIEGAWYIRVTDEYGWLLAFVVWQGNAALNWFGLQGAVDRALDRARKYVSPSICPGTPHRGHTGYGTPCPLDIKAEVKRDGKAVLQ